MHDKTETLEQFKERIVRRLDELASLAYNEADTTSSASNSDLCRGKEKAYTHVKDIILNKAV